MPSFLQIAFSLRLRPRRDFASLRIWQLDAGAPRLGQPNRNRLLLRLSAVISFANVMHLFTDKLTGLRAGRFSLLGIMPSFLNDVLLRHVTSERVSPTGQLALAHRVRR